MNDSRASNPQAPAAPPPKTSAPSPRTLAFLVAVNGILTAILVVGLIVRPTLPEPEEPVAPPPRGEGQRATDGVPATDESVVRPGGRGPVVALDELIVHLRNPEVDRYARISLEVELTSGADLRLLQARRAEIRDAILSWLTDRTYEELRGSAGLDAMKHALLEKMRALMPMGAVRALYVTDFVVQ
jgi:flagellar FliL protein